MPEVLTFGEPMGLMAAEEVKPLEDVDHFTRYVCGSEINFAVGIARLEHRVAYVSRLGNDPFGKHIKKFLVANNIDNRYVILDDHHNTGMQLKAKVTSGDPEVVNFRKGTAFSFMRPDDLDVIQWEGIAHLHVTGIPPALSESCRQTTYTIMETARGKGVRISFDTNLRPGLWASRDEMICVINDLAGRADIVLPGFGEAETLVGSRDLDIIADFYLKAGARTVIVKIGDMGAFCKTGDGSFTVPAFKVDNVVDTVGAGDGFAVGVVSGLLEGLPLKEAIVRGTAVGALAIMSPGDNEGLPTVPQLKAFFATHPDSIARPWRTA